MKNFTFYAFTVVAALLIFAACDKKNENKEPAKIAVTGVTVTPETLDLVEGDTETLTFEVLPEDADNKNVSWESDDESVATVEAGEVTAVAPGTATITITTDDGEKTDACIVTVSAEGIAVSGVTVTPETLDLVEGDTETLTFEVLPEEATNKNVTWESDDETVATVEGGVVTALGEGTANIKVITVDGEKEATCVVMVAKFIPVEDLRINRGAHVLKVSETITIFPIFIPENATNQNVSYESSNPNVATVDNEGLVTAITEGSARIGVTTEEGNITKYCNISVSNSITMRCSTGTPGWGESLGEVGFATEQTWEVGDLIWSDAVTASACDKDTFEGGAYTDPEGFRSDGRSIPDANSVSYKGNYFSWCAVALYQEELCPGEWRVPTNDDFVALDIALGGTGLNRNNPPLNSPLLTKYAGTEWGGEYTGWATNTGNNVYVQGSESHYWAVSERDENYGYELSFRRNMFIGPLNTAGKGIGGVLRCVKDK